jgi:anaerobic selenocysteine-containing dehydrogenase
VTPQTEVVSVFGEKMHCSMEAVMLAIAERLELPGCGKDAFGPGLDFTRPEDFYLKLFANLAWGDKKGQEVPEASTEEQQVFLAARKHLAATVFTPERWQKACGREHWGKLVYFLNRGGRFEDFNDAKSLGHDGFVHHRIKRRFNMYVEKVGTQRHSLSGKFFSGLPTYESVRDAAGQPIDDKEFPLLLSTYKEILAGQSRTLPGNYWLSAILPENFILLNSSTAKSLGFRDGDKARIISATNSKGVWELPNRKNLDMVGKIKVTEGLRPGVAAVSWGYGHWGYGASDTIVDGKTIAGDSRRQAGLCPNAGFRVDPVLKNVCMTDPIGASASYYDTRIKLVKA